ncbi:MAG TPA: translation initiation factor IF-2, partial [Alphaproteobacteria bacterium]|nr:translation initiation factor IF-2 [Alphaproteobacteria bacterium]
MSESKDSDNETTGSTPQRTLSLKKTVGSGQVRQSFSHGRSKSVVVEKKRRRVITPKSDAAAATDAPQPEAKAAPTAAPKAAPQKPRADRGAKSTRKPAPRGDRKSARGLTEGEQAARERALALAKSAEEERNRKAAQEEAERRQREVEAEARRQAEAEAEAEAAAQAEANRKTASGEPAEAIAKEADDAADLAQNLPVEPDADAEKRAVRRKDAQKIKADEDDDGLPAALKGARIKRKSGDDSKPTPRTKGEPRRRTGRLTIQTALDEDLGERQRSLASIRRSREREKQAAKHSSRTHKIVREVVIPEAITAQELANRMAIRVKQVLQVLRAMDEGAVSADMVLEPVTAQIVVEELGHRAKLVAESDVEHGLEAPNDAAGELESRPPVVTV